MDKVVVDLTQAFAHGQIYSATGRPRFFEDLRFCGNSIEYSRLKLAAPAAITFENNTPWTYLDNSKDLANDHVNQDPDKEAEGSSDDDGKRA